MTDSIICRSWLSTTPSFWPSSTTERIASSICSGWGSDREPAAQRTRRSMAWRRWVTGSRARRIACRNRTQKAISGSPTCSAAACGRASEKTRQMIPLRSKAPAYCIQGSEESRWNTLRTSRRMMMLAKSRPAAVTNTRSPTWSRVGCIQADLPRRSRQALRRAREKPRRAKLRAAKMPLQTAAPRITKKLTIKDYPLDAPVWKRLL